MKKETDNSVKDQNATCDNNMLAEVLLAMVSKKDRSIHIPSFLRIRNVNGCDIDKLKNEILELLKIDKRFTFERTSEIFITKGLKSLEKNLKFYPIKDGYYISDIVVRRDFC